jgi:hypothetical protein
MPQKGKHRPPHHKEKKQHAVPATQSQQAQAQQAQMAAPVASAMPVKVGVRWNVAQTPAAFTQARYPFIGAELKFIGIISVAIIGILVILAFVLPPLLP